MALNKKGVYWPYLLAAIIGLLVLTSGYLMFSEYFNQDEIDWDVCRQSLFMRNGMPEADLYFKIASLKNSLPVKCGTKKVTIDYEDLDRAEKEIANTIASCWYMVGEGGYRIFPSTKAGMAELDIPCMVCARIHLNKDVKEFYSGENMIDIKNGLDSDLEGHKASIWEYLNPGKGKNAFAYFSDWAEEFSINVYEENMVNSVLPDDTEIFKFSQYLKPEEGDLFIVYAQPTIEKSIDKSLERLIRPYMVLVQYDDFGKLSEKWAQYKPVSASICSSIETIPS
jgi:hypothetical protein